MQKFDPCSMLILSVYLFFGGGFLATWAVYTLAFGLPSGGTSAFWCAIAAGATGGYVGGSLGGRGGESLGEFICRVNPRG